MPLIELTAPRSSLSVAVDKFDLQSDLIVKTVTMGQLPSGSTAQTEIYLSDGTVIYCEEDRATIRELVG